MKTVVCNLYEIYVAKQLFFFKKLSFVNFTVNFQVSQ